MHPIRRVMLSFLRQYAYDNCACANMAVVAILQSAEEFVRAFLEKEGLIESSRVLCKLSNSAKVSGEIFSSVRSLASFPRACPEHDGKVYAL